MTKLFFSFFLLISISLIGAESPSPERLLDLGTDLNDSKFFDELMSMLFTLGLLVALLLAISWFVKRMQSTRIQSGNSNSRIKILEQRQISPKTILYIVHIEDKALLIADSVNGVTQLTEFPLSINLNENAPSEQSVFDRLMQKK